MRQPKEATLKYAHFSEALGPDLHVQEAKWSDIKFIQQVIYDFA